MTKHVGWVHIAVISLVVMGASWAMTAPGLAATSPFRFEHGEPMNNLSLTPGAVFNVRASTICQAGYAKRVRDVPESEKLAAYAEYGITNHPTNRYEIDHLISLELGGSNALANLWPELNDHPLGYLNSKDRLEDHLHVLVCNGTVALGVAQHIIATDWVAAYHRFFATWPSGTIARAGTSSSTTTPPSTRKGMVIVSIVTPISPGDDEHLVARSSLSNDSCTLSVTLPSGAQSAAAGVGSRTASSTGTTSWTWRIGTTTRSGVARAMVSCRAGSLSVSFVIA